MLPLVASMAIHAGAVMLVLALTFSDGIVDPPVLRRGMILLAPAPVVHSATAFIATPHAVTHASQATDRTAPRRFRPPLIRPITAPLRESAPVPTLQIPLPEVARQFLPAVEVAHLAAAPAPPLRTDNLAPLAGRLPPATNSAATPRPAALGLSGFDEMAIETPPHPGPRPLSGGEFGDATMLPAGQPRPAGTGPARTVTRSVEILSKPRPGYTDEARRRRIEGEVLLEVLFAASSQVRVLRTMRGLGYGLDENAIAAAKAIRFRPAERAGVAADSTAIVHIVFELAY